MTIRFITNAADAAVGQAIEQSRGGQWRAVYRRRDGMFIVTDELIAGEVPIIIATDGRVDGEEYSA